MDVFVSAAFAAPDAWETARAVGVRTEATDTFLGVASDPRPDTLRIGPRGFASVHDAARELGREHESCRRLRFPAADQARIGHAVVGHVCLDGLELRRVVAELRCCGQSFGIKNAGPALLRPARCAE